jgi:hypothetical protein
MSNLSKPGHLLNFSKDEKSYFMYLFIREKKRGLAALTVLPEIERIAEDFSMQLEIMQFSELKRIIPVYPELADGDLVEVPLDIFIDKDGEFKKNLFLMCFRNLLKGYMSVFPMGAKGSIARDFSFVNYRDDLKTIINDYIEKGRHVIIEAPRRAGKTSFLFRVVEEARAEVILSIWNVLIPLWSLLRKCSRQLRVRHLIQLMHLSKK